MGCLNSNQGFKHWFGNIHLSGPCNRSCYFCIGQHMMALDTLNNLDTWPLAGLDEFVNSCLSHNVREINITGTNTDPLLFQHHHALVEHLRTRIEGVTIGIRTNGVLATNKPDVWRLYDKASVTFPCFDPDVYQTQMGQGSPPDLWHICNMEGPGSLKINVVLDPAVVAVLMGTLDGFADMGITRVNLREPYGQPRVGDPLEGKLNRTGTVLGMPQYEYRGISIVHWDVHYVEVESVNLYASGKVSVTYPITRGHDDETGEVLGQEHWTERGRHRDQWQ